MDKNTKWVASIYQEYMAVGLLDGKRAFANYSTRIISLTLKATSASDAEHKASAWLLGKGTENAFVGDVRCVDIQEVDSGE